VSKTRLGRPAQDALSRAERAGIVAPGAAPRPPQDRRRDVL